MYGLTGHQDDVVKAIESGLFSAAKADHALYSLEAQIAYLKAEAFKAAEGSNEAARKANVEVTLYTDIGYTDKVVDRGLEEMKKAIALASVEAAKVAARMIVANLVATAPER